MIDHIAVTQWVRALRASRSRHDAREYVNALALDDREGLGEWYSEALAVLRRGEDLSL